MTKRFWNTRTYSY